MPMDFFNQSEMEETETPPSDNHTSSPPPPSSPSSPPPPSPPSPSPPPPSSKESSPPPPSSASPPPPSSAPPEKPSPPPPTEGSNPTPPLQPGTPPSPPGTVTTPPSNNGTRGNSPNVPLNPSGTTVTSPPRSSSSGSAVPIIAGVVVGGVVVLALTILFLVCSKNKKKKQHGKGVPVMNWSFRMPIALGSAKGLAYLYEDCHPQIIHRDIKTANILLDGNYEAMVADFGLAKLSSDNFTHVSTRVMGTFGYLAPEYASIGKLSIKSDVFSFGGMLLELITGRRPVDPTGKIMEDNVVDWKRMQFCGNFYTTTRVKPDSDTSGVGSEAISGPCIPFPQYPDQLDQKAFMKGVYESAVRQKRKQCCGTSTRVKPDADTSGVESEAIFGPCKLFPQYCKHCDEKAVMKDLYAEIPAVQGSGTVKYGNYDPLGPLLIEFANLAIDYYNLQYNTCYQFLEIKYASRSVWGCGDTFLFTFEAQTHDKKKLDHFKATMFHRFNKERKLEEVVLLEPNSRPWIRIPMFTL